MVVLLAFAQESPTNVALCLTRVCSAPPPASPQLNLPIQRRVGARRKTLPLPPHFIPAGQRTPTPRPRMAGKMRGPTGKQSLPPPPRRRRQRPQAGLLSRSPLLVCLTKYLPHSTRKKGLRVLLDWSLLQRPPPRERRPPTVRPLSPREGLQIATTLQGTLSVRGGSRTVAVEGRGRGERKGRERRSQGRSRRRSHVMRAARGEKLRVGGIG